MKKLLPLLIAIAGLTCISCSKEEPIDDIQPQQPKEYKQPKLKDNCLKVLAIGNSFLEDPFAYLNSLVLESKIDPYRLCIYAAMTPSTSLDYWSNIYNTGEKVRISRYSGRLVMPVIEAPLSEILSQDWDIITLQQLSSMSTVGRSFHPSLENLVSYIRKHCTNKNVLIGWQMIWSYGNQSKIDCITSWQKICLTMQNECNPYIDFVIPTGTAIQNARGTSLNTPHLLTRDGNHLGYGVGRYVASCTWFQSLLTPAFGVSVLGNSAIHEITDKEQSNSRYETVAVTSSNNFLCQQCAVAACVSPWQITYIPE